MGSGSRRATLNPPPRLGTSVSLTPSTDLCLFMLRADPKQDCIALKLRLLVARLPLSLSPEKSATPQPALRPPPDPSIVGIFLQNIYARDTQRRRQPRPRVQTSARPGRSGQRLAAAKANNSGKACRRCEKPADGSGKARS